MKSASSFLYRLFFAFSAMVCCHAKAEVVTLMATVTGDAPTYSTAEVVLADGDFASVTSQINQVSSNASTAVVEIGGKEFAIPNNLTVLASPGSGGSSSIVPTNGWTFAGPARIRAKVHTSEPSHVGRSVIATVSVVRANAVPTITPLNAAVIPSDATGNFSVILESSTDMVTWTPANPGTYSSTIAKRFFRVRIVKL
jgi:hypothetical protein